MWPSVLLDTALREARRSLRRGAQRAGAAWPTVRERFAYHRRELMVLGLLGASLAGGLAVELCRRRVPGLLERLETEPAAVALRSGGRRPDGAAVPAARPTTSPPAFAASGAPADPPPPLDVNRASADDLDALPGIGPRLAARIVATREALGGRFASPDDLARVPGLGPRRLAVLRPLVSAGLPAAPPAAPDPGEVREPP